MGKVKSGTRSPLHQHISELKDVSTSDGKVPFCEACEKNVLLHNSILKLHNI